MGEYVDSRFIKTVEFIFENCESVIVPIESFSYIELRKFNNDRYELNCRIDKFDNVKYDSCYPTITPLERFKMFNDITQCRIEMKDGNIINCPLIWKNVDSPNNNVFQRYTLVNNRILTIEVSAQNLVDLKRKESEECLNSFLKITKGDCKYCSYMERCSELIDNHHITLCGYIEEVLK